MEMKQILEKLLQFKIPEIPANLNEIEKITTAASVLSTERKKSLLESMASVQNVVTFFYYIIKKNKLYF